MAAAVLAVYACWLIHWLETGHSPRDLVLVGEHFIGARGTSSAIRSGPVRATSPGGFDGQFFYYIAVDPLHAAPSIDFPSYRYQRITYPLAARLLALGRPRLVPAAMLALNLAAVVGGTLALASWLVRRDVTPWAAAVWGLLPGQVVSIERDLVDGMGYAIVMAGLWLRDSSAWGAALVFAVAGLTRETTLIFPLVLSLADLLERRPWRQAVGTAAVAVLPFALWKLALWTWLGHSDVPVAYNFQPVPFGGVVEELRRNPVPLLWGWVIPTGICLAAAAVAWLRGVRRVEPALVLVNGLVLVTFAHFHVFEWWPNATRIGLGVNLAAALMLAAVQRSTWYWLASGFSLALSAAWLLEAP